MTLEEGIATCVDRGLKFTTHPWDKETLNEWELEVDLHDRTFEETVDIMALFKNTNAALANHGQSLVVNLDNELSWAKAGKVSG